MSDNSFGLIGVYIVPPKESNEDWTLSGTCLKSGYFGFDEMCYLDLGNEKNNFENAVRSKNTHTIDTIISSSFHGIYEENGKLGLGFNDIYSLYSDIDNVYEQGESKSNIKLTAIVGENGSGKSQLMDLVDKCISSGLHDENKIGTTIISSNGIVLNIYAFEEKKVVLFFNDLSGGEFKSVLNKSTGSSFFESIVQTKIAFEKHESEQAKKYYNQFFNGVVFKSNSDTSVKVISGIELILKSEGKLTINDFINRDINYIRKEEQKSSLLLKHSKLTQYFYTIVSLCLLSQFIKNEFDINSDSKNIFGEGSYNKSKSGKNLPQVLLNLHDIYKFILKLYTNIVWDSEKKGNFNKIFKGYQKNILMIIAVLKQQNKKRSLDIDYADFFDRVLGFLEKCCTSKKGRESQIVINKFLGLDFNYTLILDSSEIKSEKFFSNKISDKNHENNLYRFAQIDVSKTFMNGKKQIKLGELSDGEKSFLARMSQVFLAISENNYDRSKNFIIMIDEPDLHLHIRRQKEYIKTLIENFMRFTGFNFHFIIATHSPFIVSDIPENNLLILSEGKDVTDQYVDYKKKGEEKDNKNTFAATTFDIVSAFMGAASNEGVTIGDFTQKIIDEYVLNMKELLIKKRNREKDNLNNKDNTNNLINPYQTEIDSLKNDYKLVIEGIGDPILKEYLLLLRG